MNNTIKLSLLLIITFLLSSCVMMPARLSIYEQRYWLHQNQKKQYYYKRYPTPPKRVQPGRKYVPYFRNGKY